MTTTARQGITHLADLLRPAAPGEGTRRIRPPALRRPDVSGQPHPTGEVPVWPTGAELAVTARFEPPPQGPPPPLPPIPDPSPSWAGPSGAYRLVEPPTERLILEPRPRRYHRRARHQECRCMPVATVVAVSVGTGAITHGVLLAVAWAVAQ